MKKLHSKTLQMPASAAYIDIVSRTGDILTVDYFRENGERLSIYSNAARVIREDTFNACITEAPEPMKKVDSPPKGKASEDPRRKDQKKRQDLPRGRKVTAGEKLAGADWKKHDGEKRRDEDKPDYGIKKRAKEHRGKVKGENQFEHLGFDPLLDQINEDDNNTLYRWQAILEAIFAAGLTEDQAREIRANLHGKEYSLGEAKLSYDEFVGKGEHQWQCTYELKGKHAGVTRNASVQTKEKDEGAAKKRIKELHPNAIPSSIKCTYKGIKESYSDYGPGDAMRKWLDSNRQTTNSTVSDRKDSGEGDYYKVKFGFTNFSARNISDALEEFKNFCYNELGAADVQINFEETDEDGNEGVVSGRVYFEYHFEESTRSFNEASPEQGDVAQVDNDLAAVGAATQDQEGKKKNEIYAGQGVEEAEEKLDTVPRRESDKIQNLQKGTVINVVRMNDNKVTKVIPTTVLKVVYSRPNFYAHCRVDAEQVTKIRIARDPSIIYLRQGEDTGVYYYLDRIGPLERDDPTVAYN